MECNASLPVLIVPITEMKEGKEVYLCEIFY